MKLSVIVPVYNVEKYIIKCLKSLLNQTINDFEVIIVDDGSTDNSFFLCEKFIKENNCKTNFILLHKKNGGLSDARNFGIKFAKGVYISFLDSDDYVEYDYYENMLKMCDNDTELVQCGYFETFEKKEKKIYVKNYNSLNEFVAYGNVVAWNKIYLRKIIELYDIKFPIGLIYEDIYFFYKYIEHVSSIENIKTLKNCYIHYVQRKTSINNTQNKNILNILEIYSKLNDCKFHDEIEYRCSRNLNGSFYIKALKIEDKKIKKEVMKSFHRFLKSNFPKWKKNKYYCIFNVKDIVIKYIISILNR